MRAAILTWLKKKDFGWTSDQVESHGLPFLQLLTDMLRYVDGQTDKLNARYCGLPEVFAQFSHYNKPRGLRHALPRLNRDTLKSCAQQLEQVNMQFWIQKKHTKNFTQLFWAVHLLFENMQNTLTRNWPLPRRTSHL